MGKNLMATKLLSGNNTKALVTLAVGGLHTSMLELTKPTWLKYAAKHGYDIVVFDDLVAPPAETESRKIHWQKCLILEHEDVCGYEDVVWLDTDVMINYHVAPCIVSHNNADKIGLVSNWGTHFSSAQIMDNLFARKGKIVEERFQGDMTIEDQYEKAGLGRDVHDSANTGVMVLKPRLHAQVLRHVFDNYEENEYSAKEEIPISHYVYKNDLANNLDRRFNWPWSEHIVEHYPFLLNPRISEDDYAMGLCVTAAWSNSWFLHFTGDVSRKHAGLVCQELHEFTAFENFWQFAAQHKLR